MSEEHNQHSEERATIRFNPKLLELMFIVLTTLLIPLLVWIVDLAATVTQNAETLKEIKQAIEKVSETNALNKNRIEVLDERIKGLDKQIEDKTHGLDKQIDGVSQTLSAILSKL